MDLFDQPTATANAVDIGDAWTITARVASGAFDQSAEFAVSKADPATFATNALVARQSLFDAASAADRLDLWPVIDHMFETMRSPAA